MTKEKWQIPPGYYENKAKSDVREWVHETGRFVASTIMYFRQGRLRVYAPSCVIDMERNAFFSMGHRNYIDIPGFVEATERVGFHNVRPITKIQNYQKSRLIKIFFEECGSVAFNRERPNRKGSVGSQNALLARGQNIGVFTEAKRIEQDVLNIAEINPLTLLAPVMSGVPIIPHVLAGLSVEREPEIDDETKGKVIWKDRSAPFGLQGSVVGVFGNPIYPESEPIYTGTKPLSDSDIDLVFETRQTRDHINEAKRLAPIVRLSMQQIMDIGYGIRDGDLKYPLAT